MRAISAVVLVAFTSIVLFPEATPQGSQLAGLVKYCENVVKEAGQGPILITIPGLLAIADSLVVDLNMEEIARFDESVLGVLAKRLLGVSMSEFLRHTGVTVIMKTSSMNGTAINIQL